LPSSVFEACEKKEVPQASGGGGSPTLKGHEEDGKPPSFFGGYQLFSDVVHKKDTPFPKIVWGNSTFLKGHKENLPCSLERTWPPNILTLQTQQKI
jgi:hypothetical protein